MQEKGGAQMLTRAECATHIANAELADIDRDIIILNEDRARHTRCGQCWRWRNDTAMIDQLLAHRLPVSDWQKTMAMDYS